jgi:hypothetical protein
VQLEVEGNGIARGQIRLREGKGRGEEKVRQRYGPRSYSREAKGKQSSQEEGKRVRGSKTETKSLINIAKHSQTFLILPTKGMEFGFWNLPLFTRLHIYHHIHSLI